VGEAALDDLDRELRERREERREPGRSPAEAAESPVLRVRLAAWYLREALLLAIRLRLARALDRALAPLASPPRKGSGTMDPLIQNLRLALRRLRRSPGFAVAAVLTLALGVGANVAVFSVVHTVLLDPLPYDRPDELVALWEWNVPRDRRENVANPGNVAAWRERSETLEDVAYTAFFDQPMLLEGEGAPEEVLVRLASPNFFEVLGMEAALGRTFSAAAGGSEGAELVLSHGYWIERLGGDPGAIGRGLDLGGGFTGTIVGVLPPEYVVWGERSQLYASWVAQGDQTSTGRFLNALGRLRDGASVEQARLEMDAIAAGLRAEHPDFNAGWGVTVTPLQAQVVGEADQILWVLLGAVGMLLLIACANVSNLFLARATGRRREMAVRSSLGATRRTLVGQLLAESALLAVVGGVVGAGAAHAATRAFATRLPDAFQLPRVQSAGVDGAALLFALGVSLAAVLLFGLLPALHSSATEPGEALSESRAPGRASSRARSALVVAEVALSVVLLFGAGLVARSLGRLLDQEIGVRAENVLTARVALATASYQDPAARSRLLAELAERVQAVPGVDAAGMIPFLPLDGLGSATSYWAGDRPVPRPEEVPATDVRTVVGDYFGAMDVRRVAGRTFDARDRAEGPRVVVVSRALAEEAWPGQDPLGRPLVLSWGDPDYRAEVIGVVEDVRMEDVRTAPRAAVYYPYAQFPDFNAMYLVVRSSGAVSELRPLLARALHDADPSLALGNVRRMEDIVGRSIARPRLTALLMTLFAGIAAALAAVGLYGVLSYAVAQRGREIGIRIALGARPRGLLVRVVAQGMAFVLVGLVVGLGAAFLLSRFLEGMLFGVEPGDPVTLAGTAAFLGLVALAASAAPAWRSTRVDPADALRAE
jgi:predicted permease